MNIEKYPKPCSQCGAPLTRVNDDIFCEYCGQKYTLKPPPELETEKTQNQQEENLIPEKNEESSPDEEKAQEESTAAAFQDEGFKGNVSFVRYVIGILSIMLICYLISYASSNSNRNDQSSNQATKTDANNQIEEEPSFTASISPQITLTQAAVERSATQTAYVQQSLIELINQYQHGGIMYPIASNEDLPVATAMTLEYADANNLIFSLFVHNQSGKDIDPSSLQEHLEIDSLAVTSDRQDEFLCSLQKTNWNEDIFLNNHTRRKGMISCSGSLNPESILIVIDFDMPNWGRSHLEIPIQADNEDLQSSIELELASDSYSIAVELHSEQPQLVWMKKSDIIINDDTGNTMLLDGCTPNTSQQGAGEYFLKLTYPSEFDDKFIICQYGEPFPSEINTMSASLRTASGEIFTSQAVINKSEGLILFNEQSKNNEHILLKTQTQQGDTR